MPDSPPTTPLAFHIGQTNRALPGQKVSGDGLLVLEEPDFILFAVIDGLGHGEAAARATAVCLSVFKAGVRCGLEELLTRAHNALRGERGVVAGLLRVRRVQATFEAAIVGNVSIAHQRHVPGMPAKRVHVLGQPGVLGSTLRRMMVQTGEVCAGDVFVLHTDGIQSRAEFGPLAGLQADECADRIVAEFGKPSDDCACLVVRVVGGNARPSMLPPATRPRLPSLAGDTELVRVQRMNLTRTVDAPVAASMLLALARQLGASEKRAWELSIVASELASNATRHAGGGQLDVFFDAAQGEIVLDVRDVGSAGGISSGSGLGVGLQAVERLADSVEIERTPQGVRVIVKKRLHNPS